MELLNYIGINKVIIFVLLFARFSGLFGFFPFFNHSSVPTVIKTALIFLLTLFTFPYAKPFMGELTLLTITLAVISEIFLGLMAGLVLYLILAAIELAGEQISFVMGFTMASVMDPQTGINTPLISQFLSLIAITVFLAFDGHHYIIMLYFKSLDILPLGEFYPNVSMWEYISKGVLNLFVFGFIFSFPVKALALLADLIFGMLMKTMPQFNLLVVGFPIKIMLAFSVITATLSAIYSLFKTQILEAIEQIYHIFL